MSNDTAPIGATIVTPVSHTQASASDRSVLLKDIGAKWGKFSESDLSRLKNNDDLVAQVVAKYGLDQTAAKTSVSALMNGRHI